MWTSIEENNQASAIPGLVSRGPEVEGVYCMHNKIGGTRIIARRCV